MTFQAGPAEDCDRLPWRGPGMGLVRGQGPRQRAETETRDDQPGEQANHPDSRPAKHGFHERHPPGRAVDDSTSSGGPCERSSVAGPLFWAALPDPASTTGNSRSAVTGGQRRVRRGQREQVRQRLAGVLPGEAPILARRCAGRAGCLRGRPVTRCDESCDGRKGSESLGFWTCDEL